MITINVDSGLRIITRGEGVTDYITGPLAVQVEGEPEPHVFTGHFVIGWGLRAAESGINLAGDHDVSPYHAQCYPGEDGTWVIEDGASKNGAWAGDVDIVKARLSEGATVRVGRTVLTFAPA